MKSSLFFSTLVLAATTLSACGTAPTAMMPRMQRMAAAAPQRMQAQRSAGQLTYAYEMRGFSSIQNPIRTMQLEYILNGETLSMHSDRFLKHPEFNISIRIEAPNPNQNAQYFSSKDTPKVKALLETLQQLDASALPAVQQEALARILDHLKSAL